MCVCVCVRERERDRDRERETEREERQREKELERKRERDERGEREKREKERKRERERERREEREERERKRESPILIYVDKTVGVDIACGIHSGHIRETVVTEIQLHSQCQKHIRSSSRFKVLVTCMLCMCWSDGGLVATV